jgi:two-component sensor histidine kinase
LRLLLRNALVAAAYSVTGWIGLQLPYFGEHITLIWAPVGIALAAIILYGPTIVPGIALGSFAANVVHAGPAFWYPAATVAVGNTLGPTLAGLCLTRKLGFRPQLDRIRDVRMFAAVGVLGTSLVTAALGSLSLYAFGAVEQGALPSAWSTWLAGDASGVLVFGAAALVWLSPPDAMGVPARSITEKVALAVSGATLSAITFAYGTHLHALAYTLFPTLLWAALRFGPRGASLTSVVITVVMVSGTALGAGPFIEETSHLGILSLWVFFSIIGSSALLVAALMAERDGAVRHQLHLMSELDHRVKNTLATVVALAERSRVSAVDADDYFERLVARIRAIARTHEGMARTAWRGMCLEDVVAMTLAPFDVGSSVRIAGNGDRIVLDSATVAPITMMLHELATNTAKHGAWSRPGGSVEVTWARGEGGGVYLVWTETGGPEIAGTPSAGYGLRLIEGLVGHELGGRVLLDFQRAGLVCSVELPAR